MKDLLELLENAGYSDFRDARGPMGFSQRQAGGKFTSDEAAELIDQLQTAEYEAAQAPTKRAEPKKKAAAPKKAASSEKTVTKEDEAKKDEAKKDEPMTDLERAVRTASTKSLVLEVRRRGWTVTKPK